MYKTKHLVCCEKTHLKGEGIRKTIYSDNTLRVNRFIFVGARFFYNTFLVQMKTIKTGSKNQNSNFNFPSTRDSFALNFLSAFETNPLIIFVFPFVQRSFTCVGVSFFFKKVPGNVCLQPVL